MTHHLPPRSRRAFSLLEMLIVLAIIGLLAALVVPRIADKVGQSRVTTTKAQINSLAAAVEEFNLDIGRYPSPDEGLTALVQRPSGVEEAKWDGPYLQRNFVPADGWGRDFQYEFDENGRYLIRSLGADGEVGGEGENADLDNRNT